MARRKDVAFANLLKFNLAMREKAEAAMRRPEMYVAVVYNEHADKTRTTSARPYGDWASFVSYSKDDAIKQAINARESWQAKASYPISYKILVGKLTYRCRRSMR